MPPLTRSLLREVEDGLRGVVDEDELSVGDGAVVVADVLGARVDVEVDEAEIVAGEALLAALDHVEDPVDGARRRLVVAQDHVHVEDGDVLRRFAKDV